MRDGIKATNGMLSAILDESSAYRESCDEALVPRDLPGSHETRRPRQEIAALKVENRHLAAQVEALRSGASAVLHELDTKMLVRTIARQATHLLNAELAIVELYDQDVAYFRASHHIQSTFYNRAETTQDLSLEPEAINSLSQWVVRHRQSHLFREDCARPGFSGTDLLLAGCRNALCVPMLDHQGYVVGLLQVQNHRVSANFTQQEVAVAETLATQATIGLERSRLFDRMQEWSQSLETLLAFNAAVNQHLNPSELVRRLVENAARFLKADGAFAGLALPVEPGSTLVMSTEAYWDHGLWHDWVRTWRPLEGLPGHVLENEFPYLANEYPEERIADAELLARFEVHRALCVPIKDVADCVLGFFELHRGSNQPPFTWQDAAFVESLANTTAVAIRNAQLIKALEIKSEALELKTQQVRALSAHNLLCLEAERKHIARELHDEAGQALIAIQLGLQLLVRQVPPEFRSDLAHLSQQVNHSTKLLGNLAKRLRPATLDRLGLHGALRQLALDYQERLGIPIMLDLSSSSARLPREMELALYRIAQEALTNAAKYAQATRVDLMLMEEEGDILLSVRDDGRGFDTTAKSIGSGAQLSAGLGLMGMKERAEMLSGRLAIESAPGRGTDVVVRVALP
jgi:signal transduction histidine kinase